MPTHSSKSRLNATSFKKSSLTALVDCSPLCSPKFSGRNPVKSLVADNDKNSCNFWSSCYAPAWPLHFTFVSLTSSSTCHGPTSPGPPLTLLLLLLSLLCYVVSPSPPKGGLWEVPAPWVQPRALTAVMISTCPYLSTPPTCRQLSTCLSIADFSFEASSCGFSISALTSNGDLTLGSLKTLHQPPDLSHLHGRWQPHPVLKLKQRLSLSSMSTSNRKASPAG